MQRRIYRNNSDVLEKFTLLLGHNVQPRRLPLDEKDVYYSLLSILQYLTKGIALLLLALGYVHACQRPHSVGPYYDGNSVGIQVKWKFKRSTEHVS